MMLPLPLSVAVLSDCCNIPWQPIDGALCEAVRCLDGVAHLFHVGGFPSLVLTELEAFEPAAIILPAHQMLARSAGPFLRFARARSIPVIGAFFDDPYDHKTALDLLPNIAAVLTPEPLCADVYREMGKPAFVLPPFCDPRSTVPTEQRQKRYDIFHVGATNRAPRHAILPPIREAAARRGLQYGEAAGVSRWVVGRELADLLTEVRVLLEVPRFELAPSTNPHLVSCTYASPRFHLAAAARTMVLVIGPRGDIQDVWPEAPCVDPGDVDGVLAWAAPEREREREERAEAMHARWLREHQPRNRAPIIAEALRAVGVAGV